MKLNISSPTTGCVKTLEVDEERKLLAFYEKRIGAEVAVDSLGPEWKGYSVRITGGNDKQGFPMLQGVLCNHRVRLLFRKGMKCYRERRAGSMRRKSVRGCIVSSDLSALNLVVTKKGEEDIPGLTDTVIPSRRGPKRANKIRKLFGLSKDDDVRKFVVRRVIKEGKKTKAPKIQRLITAERIQRKRTYKNELKRRSEKTKTEAAEFAQIVKDTLAARKAARVAAREALAASKHTSVPATA